jgi:hypothetical protein
MVTLQIPTSLIVLPGRCLIVLPLGDASDDCELELDFRDDFFRRSSFVGLLPQSFREGYLSHSGSGSGSSISSASSS